MAEKKSIKTRRMLENQKEYCPAKKLNLQSAKLSKEDAKPEKTHPRDTIYEKISAFNALFSDFAWCEVNTIKAYFTVFKYFPVTLRFHLNPVK